MEIKKKGNFIKILCIQKKIYILILKNTFPLHTHTHTQKKIKNKNNNNNNNNNKRKKSHTHNHLFFSLIYTSL